MSFKMDASTNTNSRLDASTTATSVYQFEIVLHHIHPPIWRRIQVPENFTFFDLNVAIQDLFQWSGQHLHKFEMVKSKSLVSLLDFTFELKEYIGIPDRGLANDCIILPEKETRIADQFSLNKNKCVYTYDFSSEWVSSYLYHISINCQLYKTMFSCRDTTSHWKKYLLHFLTSIIQYALKVTVVLLVNALVKINFFKLRCETTTSGG